MSLSNPTVLVLDADMVPALIVTRSLAARGCIVHLAGHTENPLSRYSNAPAKMLQYPDPLTRTDEFVSWLHQQGASTHYDLIVPVTERTMVPLSRCRDDLEALKIAMPDAQSLDLVLDKSETMALAQELGVRVPVGVQVHTLADVEALIDEIKFPVVLKPARSIGSGDEGASQLQVSYAFDVMELRAGCTHALRFGSLLLQEYFPGSGVGIELIAKQGEIAYAFQHRRLHEVPLTGGGSSLRRSEAVNPELLEASRMLIEALRWNGVAMVEFKLNSATGEFCLMEINGRFWGSLPLADAAGADFPSMLLDLELHGDIQNSPPYDEEVYCRLLSRDLFWYEAVLRDGADSRIARLPQRAEIVRELHLFLSFKHYFDVQSFRDIRPGLVDFGRIIKTYFARLQTLRAEKRFLSLQKRHWKRGEVARAIDNAASVLFLCYGNINRSALADVLIRAYAEDSGIRVASAGFHQVAERPSDPVMVEIAQDNGQNMQEMRSTMVTRELLRSSDVIFVMDKVQYERVVEIDAAAAPKTFLLGAHQNDAGWHPEIEDPYGRSRERYMACYVRIADAIDTLKSMIAVRHRD